MKEIELLNKLGIRNDIVLLGCVPILSPKCFKTEKVDSISHRIGSAGYFICKECYEFKEKSL